MSAEARTKLGLVDSNKSRNAKKNLKRTIGPIKNIWKDSPKQVIINSETDILSLFLQIFLHM